MPNQYKEEMTRIKVPSPSTSDRPQAFSKVPWGSPAFKHEMCHDIGGGGKWWQWMFCKWRKTRAVATAFLVYVGWECMGLGKNIRNTKMSIQQTWCQELVCSKKTLKRPAIEQCDSVSKQHECSMLVTRKIPRGTNRWCDDEKGFGFPTVQNISWTLSQLKGLTFADEAIIVPIRSLE